MRLDGRSDDQGYLVTTRYKVSHTVHSVADFSARLHWRRRERPHFHEQLSAAACSVKYHRPGMGAESEGRGTILATVKS
jgi:hypothetical protein